MRKSPSSTGCGSVCFFFQSLACKREEPGGVLPYNYGLYSYCRGIGYSQKVWIVADITIFSETTRHFLKTCFDRNFCHLQFKSFCVRAVLPALSAKPPGIFPRAYVSTFSVIGPRTFLNIYKILNIAALYALVTVSAS